MKYKVSVLTLLLLIHACACQYPITIDGLLSDWRSESSFSGPNNITCYFGWYSTEFYVAIKTTSVPLTNITVMMYFNVQPYQTFIGSANDTGTSVPVVSSYGPVVFPFKADYVLRWSFAESLSLFVFNGLTWNGTNITSTNATTAGIIEAKFSNANNTLAPYGFTSMWVQIYDATHNIAAVLPGQNMSFTFPMVDDVVPLSWNGYLTGFPATTKEAGDVYNSTKWLADISSYNAKNTSAVLKDSSTLFNGIFRVVNVAVPQNGILSNGNTGWKFGHDQTSYVYFQTLLPLNSSLWQADILFDNANIDISAMYIGSPAKVTFQNYQTWQNVFISNLILASDTTSGSDIIEMEFHNYSLPIYTLSIYPAVQLSTIVSDNGTQPFAYQNNSILIYKNSSFANLTTRTDEWNVGMNTTPNNTIIEPSVQLHLKLDDAGVLQTKFMDIQGTLIVDGTSLDALLYVHTLTISPGGYLHVMDMDVEILDQFLGATSSVKCESGRHIYLGDSTRTWPYFQFAVKTLSGTTLFNSQNLTNTLAVAENSNATFYLTGNYSGTIFSINGNGTFLSGVNIVLPWQPYSSTYYVAFADPTTGCETTATIQIDPQSVSSIPSTSPKHGNSLALLGLIALIVVIPVALLAFLIMKRRSAKNKQEHDVQEMSAKLPVEITPPESNSKFADDRYTRMNSSNGSENSGSQINLTTAQNPLAQSGYTMTPVTAETRKSAVLQRSSSLNNNWEIDFNEIKILEELGRGAFGVVYKCKWRNTECVVKQIDKDNAIDLTSILKEANNVRNIRSHPNVCQVFGVCTNPDHPICIVMEYLADGSLDNLLYEEKITITPQRLLEFAKSIASGMSHVHKENILHCDLACRNILVEQKRLDKYVLKVADFGLSRVVETSEYKASSSSAFPIRWTAPEALRSGKISRASDVWSYEGVTLWEIAEAKRPYPELTNSEVLEGVCDRGLRLPRPKRIQIQDELWELMQRCWLVPSERPSFDAICEELDRIEEKYYGSNAAPAEVKKDKLPSKEKESSDGSTSYANMAEYRRSKEE